MFMKMPPQKCAVLENLFNLKPLSLSQLILFSKVVSSSCFLLFFNIPSIDTQMPKATAKQLI